MATPPYRGQLPPGHFYPPNMNMNAMYPIAYPPPFQVPPPHHVYAAPPQFSAPVITPTKTRSAVVWKTPDGVPLTTKDPKTETKPAPPTTQSAPVVIAEKPHSTPVKISAPPATAEKAHVAPAVASVPVVAAVTQAPVVKEAVPEPAAQPTEASAAPEPVVAAASVPEAVAKPEVKPEAKEETQSAAPIDSNASAAEPARPALSVSTEPVKSDDAAPDTVDSEPPSGQATPVTHSRPLSRVTSQAYGPAGVRVITKDELLLYRVYTAPPETFASFPKEIIKNNAKTDIKFNDSKFNASAVRKTSRSGAGGNKKGDGGGDGGRSRQKRGGQQSGAETPVVPALVVSENAYKVRSATEGTPEERALRSIRAILNKLAAENFDALKTEILETPITSAQLLSDIVDLFFEKAVDEPLFGPIYARMCAALRSELTAPVRVPKSDPESRKAIEALGEVEDNEIPLELTENKNAGDMFRYSLLTKCQASFHNKEHRAELMTVEEKAKLTQAEIEERDFLQHRMKRQMLGIMTFIGELFKERLLKAAIMHECFNKLTAEGCDEQDIECCCNLFRTVGRQLDVNDGKDKGSDNRKQVTDHIGRLKAAITRGNLSARTRFMIESIVELRDKDKWIPKDRTRVDHSRHDSDDRHSRTSSRQGPDRSSRGGRASQAAQPVEEKINPASLGMKNQGSSAQPQVFAPGGKQMRGTLSSGGSQNAPKQTPTPATILQRTNAFGALAIEDNMEANESAASTETDSPAKPAAAAAATAAAAAAATAAPKKPTGNRTEVEKKTRSLVEEYLNSFDATEAVLCFKDLQSHNLNALITTTLILDTLEKKKDQIEKVVQFAVINLLKEKLLDPADFVAGLDDAFEGLDDLVTDIPSCASIAATYISQALLVDALPLEELSKLEKLRASETYPTVVKHILAKVGDAPNASAITEALA